MALRLALNVFRVFTIKCDPWYVFMAGLKCICFHCHLVFQFVAQGTFVTVFDGSVINPKLLCAFFGGCARFLSATNVLFKAMHEVKGRIKTLYERNGTCLYDIPFAFLLSVLTIEDPLVPAFAFFGVSIRDKRKIEYLSDFLVGRKELLLDE